MKSIELNWIRNYDKSLVIPEVVFSSTSNVGGRYYEPKKDELLIDNTFYNLQYGIIEISQEYPDETHRSLAHEWRHHWQKCNGWNVNRVFCWPEKFNLAEYDSLIKKYFLLNIDELDALRFEYKLTGIPEEWKRILYQYICH